MSRAKSAIFELALCNEWDYFFTVTIDKQKYDRYDLEKYHKAFSQWIQNYNKKHELKLKYLAIPEQHEDGAWHEHGFIMGLPTEHLTAFTLEEKLPKYIRQKIESGIPVYNWKPYAEKFGFCDFEEIRNHEAVSRYVTKYITKDLSKSVTEMNAHLYYCSKGLERSTVMKKGQAQFDIIPDYEGDYCKVQMIDYDEGTAQSLMEQILTEQELMSLDNVVPFTVKAKKESGAPTPNSRQKGKAL